MMNRTPPSSSRSLDARLRNLARTRGVPERRVRRLISIVVIGQLLGQTGCAAIKGASNIEIRLGARATRVSSDLDTVCRVTIDRFRNEFATALHTGWAGFAGVLIDDGEIAVPTPDGYRPHRYRVKLEYRAGPFGTVTVEVAPEEIGSMSELHEVAARLFAARNAHPWPPRVTARHGWQARYSAEAEGLDVLADLNAAVAWTNQLITQIEASKGD